MNKSVSAIIVTYNRINELLRCINSVKTQSILPNHIIIVNNASTDDTEKIMDTARLVLKIFGSLSSWPVFIACSMLIYYLSYKITCCLYLKGVEHYGE